MEGVPDLRVRTRRRFAIGAVSFVVVAAAAVAYLVWQRAHLRSAARERVLDAARELQRCLVGADDVRGDQVLRTLYLRSFDGVLDDAKCEDGARARVRQLEDDVDIRDLPDDVAALVADLEGRGPSLSDTISIDEDWIETVRRQVAVIGGTPPPEELHALPDFRAKEAPQDGHLEGDLLVSETGAGDGSLRIQVLRPDLSTAEDTVIPGPYAFGDGDFVYQTEDWHLRRWRSHDGTVVDAPKPPGDYGWIRAWRRVPGGAVGVFFTEGGYWVQRLDDALGPVGPGEKIAADPRPGIVIAPDGTVGLAPSEGTTCVSDRVIWNVDADVVSTAAIGQPLAAARRLPDDSEPIASACDEDHLYVVGHAGYVVCDRTQCTLARALPGVRVAAVRAHHPGAEVIAKVGQVVLVIDDLHGDGHVAMELFGGELGFEPFVFRGRWFAPHARKTY